MDRLVGQAHGRFRRRPAPGDRRGGRPLGGAGQRAWQYAGTFGDGTCSVRGLPVDIDVADSAVLATTGTGPNTDPGGHPDQQTYIVQPGDTLSGIAAKLHVPGGWQALYKLNRDVIGPNPDVITPGEKLKLP
jgi:nucleoid-associated protein YgaU